MRKHKRDIRMRHPARAIWIGNAQEPRSVAKKAGIVKKRRRKMAQQSRSMNCSSRKKRH